MSSRVTLARLLHQLNDGGDSVNRPITYVDWFEAARLANSMTNGDGSGSTETGAYTLSGETTGKTVAANPGASFRLPTENEWDKSAYRLSPRNFLRARDRPQELWKRSGSCPGVAGAA